MNVNVFIIPEAIGCILFALLIYRFSTNGHNGNITPFFVFFYSTGVAGIISIIGGWFIRLAVTLPVTPDTVYIAYIGHITNGISILAHTVGKTLGLANRYDVLLNLPFPAPWWNKKNLTRLITIQYGIPAILHVYWIGTCQIDWEWRDGVQAYDGLAKTAGLLNRLVYGGTYVVYVFVSIILNCLAVLRLRKLIRQKALSQQRLLHQNKVLVLYGICSTIAHFLCASHQIYWTWAYFTEREEHQDLARDLSAPVNDITTFCNPILLLIVSPQARAALYSRSIKRSKLKSTSQSQSFCPISIPMTRAS